MRRCRLFAAAILTAVSLFTVMAATAAPITVTIAPSLASVQVATAPTSQSADLYGYPGTNAVISSAGTSDGVVWALNTTSNGTGTCGSGSCAPAVLRAYDATDLGSDCGAAMRAAPTPAAMP